MLIKVSLLISLLCWVFGYVDSVTCNKYFSGWIEGLEYVEESIPSSANNCNLINQDGSCCSEQYKRSLGDRLSSRYAYVLDTVKNMSKAFGQYQTFYSDYLWYIRQKEVPVVQAAEKQFEQIRQEFTKNVEVCYKAVFAHEATTSCISCSAKIDKYLYLQTDLGVGAIYLKPET